jgi:AcrR family transcriptional regulator
VPNTVNRPRKSPIQSRSTELVSAIFEASVRILKAPTTVKFNTRSVADLAGISVGSLYQYFPNKEALIGALIEREAKKHVQKLLEKYEHIKDQPNEAIIRGLIGEIVNMVARDKGLLKGIMKSIFKVERLEAVIQSRELAVTFISKILVEKKVFLDPNEATLKAYMIVAAMGGVSETIIFRTTDDFSVLQLSDEMTSMIIKYCQVS